MKPSVSLIPLSTIYRAVLRTRLAAYRRGWFSIARLPVPVISVGNLTTGGTGKTPLVEWVCRAMAGRDSASDVGEGKRICVLTRGYGKKNPKAQVVVSNGNEVLAGEREAGDEPFLLASKLLGIAAVVANPNRAAAGQWAIEELNTEVFVLDDGFQHLRLARDLDIVTIDATDPWGSGGLLPYGRLREPRSGLSRADCLVITRADEVEDTGSIRKALEQLAGRVPIFSARIETSRIRTLEGEDLNRERLQAQQVGAFCGVGNPQSFFSQLRREGIGLAFTRRFSDHHRYTQSELTVLENEVKARGATGLITTAKDAIKLSSLKLELPCYVLEIQIRIDNEDRLVEIVRSVAHEKREL
jgi:tetraacyldisaccharide 4'-kinase